MSLIGSMVHGARQAARVAWYGALYAETRRRAVPSQAEKTFEPKTPVPPRGLLARELGRLLREDRRNIARGRYLPPENDLDLSRLAAQARAYFADLNRIQSRREAREHQEPATEENREKYPRYYLQNFHYQSGGWLSEESARIYDTQVEVLFTGAADAMRRQALPFLADVYRERDTRACAHLELACGSGGFAAEVKRNFPSLNLVAMDLSEPYLEEAARRLAPYRRWRTKAGAAEAIPAEDGAFDSVSCVYLFHELPPQVRPRAAAEIARVLKPGGAFVFVDSIQWGDQPELDRLLEFFPVSFHEPYYGSYCAEDLDALFGAAGLELKGAAPAYLSKVRAYRKPVVS